MSRWVTFYEDIITGVHNVKIHKNKEEATKYYKRNYKTYFRLATNTRVELPMSYGYPHRKFWGISKYAFEKAFNAKIEDYIDR